MPDPRAMTGIFSLWARPTTFDTSSVESSKGERAANSSSPRDAAFWAKPVRKLEVSELPKGAINLNVAGREVVGPLQGFGQMWQKTYRLRLEGSDAPPAEVIRIWKTDFPKFWPEGNRFYAPLESIEPGEVAVLNLAFPGMSVSTGIRVIYADDESFSFMTPQGHTFAGINTFSAFKESGDTHIQVQVLVRANDPIYELFCRLGVVHKMEDQFWHHTLKALAARVGATGEVAQQTILVDRGCNGRRRKTSGTTPPSGPAFTRRSPFFAGSSVARSRAA